MRINKMPSESIEYNQINDHRKVIILNTLTQFFKSKRMKSPAQIARRGITRQIKMKQKEGNN